MTPVTSAGGHSSSSWANAVTLAPAVSEAAMSVLSPATSQRLLLMPTIRSFLLPALQGPH